MAAFLDSNVILYLAQDDVRKAEIAEALLRGNVRVSVQVLNEVAYVCRRKFGYDWRQANALLNGMRS